MLVKVSRWFSVLFNNENSSCLRFVGAWLNRDNAGGLKREAPDPGWGR